MQEVLSGPLDEAWIPCVQRRIHGRPQGGEDFASAKARIEVLHDHNPGDLAIGGTLHNGDIKGGKLAMSAGDEGILDLNNCDGGRAGL